MKKYCYVGYSNHKTIIWHEKFASPHLDSDIIEKDKSRKKNIETGLDQDVFKIREKRAKILDKKRGTGIPSLKGAVCTTREKDYIAKVIKELKITLVFPEIVTVSVTIVSAGIPFPSTL